MKIKIKTKALTVALILLFTVLNLPGKAPEPISLSGQSFNATIEGYVLDANNNGISQADVVIPEKSISVKTDPTGRFRIHCKGQGKHHIEVYKTGFLTASTKSFDMSKSMNLTLPKITLYPSPLEEVVVTGTSTPKLYRETPVKTSVATKEDIEKKGALSLADSLEIVTGVRVEDNCQNCNFTQVRINGMEGKYSQILINGQPILSALAGVYALEQIPANMIEKLEVVKGGGSALYGGNAVAGVVNVVLKESQKSGSRFSLTQESINKEPNTSLSFNTDLVSKDLDTSTSFFANYQNRSPMDYNDDDFSDLGKLTNISFGSNFSHYFNRLQGKLKLNVMSIFEDRRGGNKFDLPEHMADIAEAVKTYRTDLGLGWEQTFSLKSILKVNANFTYTKRKSYYGSQQDPNAYGETKNPVFYANATYNNFSLKNHAIVGGLSYKADILDDRAPAYNRIIDETYTDFGAFLQDEISLFNDSTSLLVGIRADKHSEISSVILSPRASILYKGVEHFTFRFTYSTGFRAPQVFDEDLHITQVSGKGQLIRNREGLREEKSSSFTAGIDFGKQVANRLYQFSVGGFYNRLDGVFTLEEVAPLPNAKVFERFNSDSAKVYGLEVEAGIKWAGKFEIFTGWTFQKSRLADPEPDFGSKTLFRSPDVYGSVRVSWDVPKLADIMAEANYTGSMKVPHFAGYIERDVLKTTKPFWVVNVSVSREIGFIKGRAVMLTASITNLFDAFQDDLDKGVFRDAGYIYGPRTPRTFRLGMKINF